MSGVIRRCHLMGQEWTKSPLLIALAQWPPRINEPLKVPEIEEREARVPVHVSGRGGLAYEPRLYS